MSNDINTLRNTLFETLRALRDRDNPIEIDRAKAINETAQVIINSVKLEIDHMRVAGTDQRTDFIPTLTAKPVIDGETKPEIERRTTHTGTETVTPIQGGVVRRHVMKC
jgi:hypothetical protein